MMEYAITVNHDEKAALETFVLDYIRQPGAMDVHVGFAGYETTPMQLLLKVKDAKVKA